MAVLAVQDIPVAGFEPQLDPADAAGDEAPTGAGTFVVVRNAGLSAVTVTARVPVAVGGVIEVAPSVAAGADLWLPVPVRNHDPHGTRVIQRDPDARATLAYSAVTDVSVGAVRAP